MKSLKSFLAEQIRNTESIPEVRGYEIGIEHRQELSQKEKRYLHIVAENKISQLQRQQLNHTSLNYR